MSTVGAALTTWEEFVQLEDEEENGTHLELHDGEVVVVPPPKPSHTYRQMLLQCGFRTIAKGRGAAAAEFPYRPTPNLQFWRAAVAYLPNRDWKGMATEEYLVYSPPLIVEVLSPSNRRSKVERQRLAAFSGGTREFWVVDPKSRTVEVFVLGKPSRVYGVGEKIPVSVLPGAKFPVRELFRS
ncbi:MAG TPA: Uma2 family endonuclease [Bryobacteraceae bacterium]